ncbi:MAG: M50 family metallopeptidase [Planctomycetes bacterium]|nr:M50 family metallopeptidase [Planctomycetota bacterium]
MSAFDHDSPLIRLLRALLRSFPVGTFFGVHVRMYWMALLLPLLFLQWVPGQGVGEALLYATISFVGLFLVIWAHEMSHIAAGWWYRIDTPLITLGPLGGVAHMSEPAGSARAELVVALAGPASHLVWLAVCWPLSRLLSPAVLYDSWYGYTVWYLVVINQSLLLFNLLPCFPLDGGRALRALLAMRWHPNRATLWATTVGIAGGAGLMLFSFGGGLGGSIRFLIGLTCVLESLRERQLARHVLVYHRTLREPWQVDAEAWKQGIARQRGGGVGWFARWRAERQQRKAARQRELDAELERDVDKALERLHEVGLSGLSKQEREVLLRASKRRKGAG